MVWEGNHGWRKVYLGRHQRSQAHPVMVSLMGMSVGSGLILFMCLVHTVKGFGIVNKAEIDVFLELSCFFHDPADVGHLISGSSTFSKTSLNIWKFMVHVLLKLGLENFEHCFTRE